MLEQPDSPVPDRFGLVDLSELSAGLTDSLLLSLLIGRGFPEGQAQHLLTAAARATDAALRRYEDARLRLEGAAHEHAIVGYLHGCEDMAIAFIALHRAMRLAEALVASRETTVTSHICRLRMGALVFGV